MPLPGSRVIPAGWDAHHRPVAENTMLDTTVQLCRPSSTTTFDETSGRSSYSEPTVLWSGNARVQRISRRGSQDTVGERFVTIQAYQVSLPVDVDEPQINDQVHVTAADKDPALVGKILRVLEVRLASNLWQRDLMCDETTPTTR